MIDDVKHDRVKQGITRRKAIVRQWVRGTGGSLRFASGLIVRIEEWAVTIDVVSRLWSGDLLLHAFLSDLPDDHAPATVTLLDTRHGDAVLIGLVALTSRTLVTETSTRCEVQGLDAPEMYA